MITTDKNSGTSDGATSGDRLTFRTDTGYSALAALGAVVFAIVECAGSLYMFCSALFATVSLLCYLRHVTIDRRAGIVTKYTRFPFIGTSRTLNGFDRVELARVERRRVTYEVRLCGDAEPFVIVSGILDYFPAATHAERVAHFLGMEVHDCGYGGTLVYRPDKCEATQTGKRPNDGSTDPENLLLVRGQMFPETMWILPVLNIVVLVGFFMSPGTDTTFIRVILALWIFGCVICCLMARFRGVLIDRRRGMVRSWRILPRFGQEHSLDYYYFVSVKRFVNPSDSEPTTASYIVALDGHKEPVGLKSFEEYDLARKFAEQTAHFLEFAVRDLVERA